MPRNDLDDLEALAAMGWNPAHAAEFLIHESAGRVPGRVVAEERGQFIVHDGRVTHAAAVSGRMRHESNGDALDYPAVGDWVAMAGGTAGRSTGPGATRTRSTGPRATGSGSTGERTMIHAVLSRTSVIVRRAPADHRTVAQIIAANVDILFIVTSLNEDLNLRRIERYLAVAWESGAVPVVVLSKADLDDDRERHLVAVAAVAPGVEVVMVSALTGDGMGEIRRHLGPGRTVAFIGSSGVGKSTIVNVLAGRDLMTTAGIRDDDARGRHTTTRRQLVPLAEGLVIDTPGMRELALLDGEGLTGAFDDVEGLARACRFNDCGHRSEPGCAVRAAVGDGSLELGRLASYEALHREARRSELANDFLARRADRRKWIAISKGVSRQMREKYGDER